MEPLWKLGKMHNNSLSGLDRAVLTPGIPRLLLNTTLFENLARFGTENRLLYFDEFMWRVHVVRQILGSTWILLRSNRVQSTGDQ